MDISNSSTTATSLNALLSQQLQPASARPENKLPEIKPESNERSSTVVTLSAQAQQLQQAEKQNRNEPTQEPAGIQFISGDKKGGQVNTFA